MAAGTEGAVTGAAELLKAIASLISAVAWPAIVTLFLIRYHKQVGDGFSAIAMRLSQAEGLELGPLKIALKKSAEIAAQIPSDPQPKDQQEAIKQQTKLGKVLHAEVIEDPAMLPEIRKKMDELARQYEFLRAARDAQRRKATEAEIVQMNKIVSQMRALAVSCVPYWKDYADSERPGDRLAAVVIIQMSPDPNFLGWLGERFRVDRPFIFYHAALAIQNMADQCWTEAREQIRSTAEQALNALRNFKDDPDKKTVDVLEGILSRS
jgi:hypothetical protein